MAEFNREKCINLLTEMHQHLLSEGINRFPRKDDFSQEETVAIKALLGPWPRALEQADIKEADTERVQKKQEKRIASKRKKTLEKIEKQKTAK